MEVEISALQELPETEASGLPLGFCCWYTCYTNPVASFAIYTCSTCTNTGA